MNARERFHATFEYGQPDRVFLWLMGMFRDTEGRWWREGLPTDQHLNSYFGFDRFERIPLVAGRWGPWPGFETKVVEQTAHWQILEDEIGAVTKVWTDGTEGMPQYLRCPVRGRDTWERFKGRLNPDDPNRHPEYWEDLKCCYRGRDYPLGIDAGSYYGWIRGWVGMENLALWYYDCPDLVHEIVEYAADMVLRLFDRALKEIPDIDYGWVWEDMAFKSGPLISPQLYREFHLGPLKRVTKALNDYGIDIIMLDSDGNVAELIPLWLEANVNVILPMEVAADCDVVRYRQQFGKQLRMLGGMDKRVLREGNSRADIEKEVMAKADLIQEGGYSPMVDHYVPYDVPFENFLYYMELVNGLCTCT